MKLVGLISCVGQAWDQMTKFRTEMQACGVFESQRREQQVKWMWSYLEERLVRLVREDRGGEVDQLQDMVRRGLTSPGAAADQVLEGFIKK